MSEPKCYCPDCGKPLTLTEEPVSKLLKDAYVFVGKCEDGHRWEVIQDLADMGRIKLTEILDSDNNCEEEDDDDIGGPEIDLADQFN